MKSRTRTDDCALSRSSLIRIIVFDGKENSCFGLFPPCIRSIVDFSLNFSISNKFQFSSPTLYKSSKKRINLKVSIDRGPKNTGFASTRGQRISNGFDLAARKKPPSYYILITVWWRRMSSQDTLRSRPTITVHRKNRQATTFRVRPAAPHSVRLCCARTRFLPFSFPPTIYLAPLSARSPREELRAKL